VAYLRGDLAGAATLLDAALALYHSLDDPWGLAVTLSARGLVTCDQGDHDRAAALFVESLAHWRSVGTKEILADWLARVATLAATRGQAERAARLFGATDALIESIGYNFEHSERMRHLIALTTARTALGEPAFAVAQATGRALPLEEAIAEAATMPDVTAPPPPVDRDVSPNDAGLTPREVEVLRLLVEGQSDRAIGEALFISHRTVMTHVANILNKLGVDSRTAAAAHAVRHKFV
jgi:non-specific serine/threonine protein kinase